MGTRSLTVFNEDDGEEIVVLYRQMDGYPEGHGQELAEFLKGIKLVNGISDRSAKIANGMSCLAAQVVARFKTEPGNFYLHKSGTRDCGEEFIYTAYPGKEGNINLKVQAGSVTFFGMPGTKQSHMPALYDGPASEFSADKCKEVHNEVRDEIPNDFIEGQREKQ